MPVDKPKEEPTKLAPEEGKPGEKPTKEPEVKPEEKIIEPSGKEGLADPLTVKLEGDTVPAKFRGKTLGEVLQMVATTDSELTKAGQENAQWRAHYQAKEVEAAKPKEKEFNPLDHLEEDQAKAVVQIIDARNKPLLDGMSGMLMEYTRSLRPDFDQYKDRIKQIYDSFLPEFKFSTDHGWDFAYRFAKAEAEGKPTPATPLPVTGQSVTGVVPAKAEKLTESQKEWAERMGMSEEKYLEFQAMKDPSKEAEEVR